SQLHPELVDLRRNIELVVDEQASFLDIKSLYVNGDRTGFELRGFLLEDVSEAIGRFFDERADVHRCEILPLELACDRVQLVQAHRRLTSRRAASEESPDIV